MPPRVARDEVATSGPNHRPMRAEERVELVEHHAGTDTDGAALEIELADPAVVAGQLDDQALAEGPAGEPGAGAARQSP